jgi:MoaA/NifB/PqqE/SkfB family radical SAM enzyme
MHCYSKSENKAYPNELTTNEAKTFIKDLAEFCVPVLLFSGGEPLLRQDIFELAKLASDAGIRPVLSTNGT